ncbi:MAG: glycosyltransferase family 2 protein [Pseudomonadota bacterium]|nr:glycosyltransferase family 2 protein [Pseudomonadota bacterium]
MLTIVVPVRNESENLRGVFSYFNDNLQKVNFEVIFINDFSSDNTLKKIEELNQEYKNFKVFDNKRKGLGGAISLGIEKARGDYVAIMMADQSDDINDLIKYHKLIQSEEYDAILGSRFLKNSKIIDYPIQKLVLNRIFNKFVSLIFWNKYNDYTNAFKIYKRKALLEIMPLISETFNIFLEIPLKIISRNYKYKVVPINWMGRKKGESKFRIKELRSKYLFTLIYCFIEKNLLNLKK